MNLCDISKPECIGILSGAVSAIVSALAMVVTAWMAIETKRMAAEAKRATDLEYLPILGIKNVAFTVANKTFEDSNQATQVKPTLNSIEAVIELFNAGRVPLSFRMKLLQLTCSGRSNDTGTYLSRSGIALPGSSAYFNSTPLRLDPPIEAFPTTGRLKLSFEYWRNGDTKIHLLESEIEYTIAGAWPGSATRWITVEDPK